MICKEFLLSVQCGFCSKPLTVMRRFLLLSLVSLSLAQGAGAQENAQAAPADEQTGHQISRVLSQKFGVAREKAEQISAAVMSSASKYSLPPALLLAIISIESRFKEKAKGAERRDGSDAGRAVRAQAARAQRRPDGAGGKHRNGIGDPARLSEVRARRCRRRAEELRRIEGLRGEGQRAREELRTDCAFQRRQDR